MKILPTALFPVVAFTFLSLPALAVDSDAQASESPFLDQLTNSYQRAFETRTAEYETETAVLKMRYVKALGRLQKFYQEGGNTDGAIATKTESDRIAAVSGLGDASTEQSELPRFEELRSTFEKSAEPLRLGFKEALDELAEKRDTALEEQISRLTKSGEVEQAIALKSKLDEWQEEKAYDPAETPKNADELFAYLTDTTWSFVEDGGRPQYMRFYPERYVLTMRQDDVTYTFGQRDYHIDKDLNVIWENKDKDIRMEFDDEFLSYQAFINQTDQPHRSGKLLHRGPELLPGESESK